MAGQGRRAPALTDWPDSRDDLIDVIDATMPYRAPDECRDACAVAVADHVLTLTGEIDCDEIVPVVRRLRLLTRREYFAAVQDLLAPAFDADESNPCVDGTTFRYAHAGLPPTTVHVAGSFNDWSPTALPMVQSGEEWLATQVIPEGRHEYKFVLEGTDWIADPANPNRSDDGFGGFNSVLDVTCASGMSPTMVDEIARRLPVENRPEGHPFDNASDVAVVTAVHAQEYAEAAERLAESLGSAVARLHACEGECTAGFVRAFGRRVFRRPLTEAEVSRYVALGSDQEARRAIVRALLSSPNFLYRSEVGVGETSRLDAYEMASALSFGIVGTTPSEELLDAAAEGELDDANGVRAHAERLLNDPRARDLVGEFALQWLGLETLTELPRTTDGEARAAQLEETRRFVQHVVFDSTGSFEELLTADYVVSESGTRVDQPSARHAGVLGHASVQTRYAHSDQSSPIQRGVFVRQRLLCQEFAPPPPEAGGVPDVDPTATTRERFRQHTESDRCAACHQYIDDVGFAFERFDENGQYRETEAGSPINTSGVLRDVEGFGSDTEATFSSLSELAGLLADSDAARDCFARQWYRFVFGASDNDSDECLVRDFADRFAETNGDIRTLVVDLLSSDAYRERR